jgi:hypothetical protein
LHCRTASTLPPLLRSVATRIKNLKIGLEDLIVLFRLGREDD